MENNLNQQPKDTFKIFNSIILLVIAVCFVATTMLLISLKKNQDSGIALQNEEEEVQEIDPLEIREFSEEERDILLAELRELCLEETADNCENDNCEEFISICLDEKLKDRVEEESDLSYCQFIENEFSAQSCFDIFYSNYALLNRQILACEKISRTDQQRACKNEVYYYLAIEGKDGGEKYCEKIENDKMKNWCLDKIK
jgi:hypothetical protein